MHVGPGPVPSALNLVIQSYYQNSIIVIQAMQEHLLEMDFNMNCK